MKEVKEQRQKDAAPNAVWPCRLKIIKPIAKRDPIILGVDIIEGTIRLGTPLCVVKVDKETGKKEIIPLGKITSIEVNHVAKEVSLEGGNSQGARSSRRGRVRVQVLKKAQVGAGAAVKIEHAVYQSAKAFGRQ